MTPRQVPVRGEDPQKPGEPTRRRHAPGPEPPAAPPAGRDESPDDDGRGPGRGGR